MAEFDGRRETRALVRIIGNRTDIADTSQQTIGDAVG